MNKARYFAGLVTAAALAMAQTPASKSILGTVEGFKVDSSRREILLKPDKGGLSAVKFGAETEVVRIAPGERDLAKGETARVTDIVAGDRVLVSFVEEMPEARRIVLITATDIATRNETYRQDWQKRGVSGVVASANGNEIVLRAGSENVVVTTTDRTIVRRYVPDSVRFSEAKFSDIAEITPGDQLQARGEKTADGLKITAQEIVFGTFITKAGKITEVDPGASQLTVQDLATKKPLTIHLASDSRLKMLPDMQAMMEHMHGGQGHGAASGGPGGHVDMGQMLEMLPPATIEDFKPGGLVLVTSTKGERSDEVTAILLLANAGFVVQMMQMQPGAQPPNGMPSLDEIMRRHGMSGIAGGGFSLPAIIH